MYLLETGMGSLGPGMGSLKPETGLLGLRGPLRPENGPTGLKWVLSDLASAPSPKKSFLFLFYDFFVNLGQSQKIVG